MTFFGLILTMGIVQLSDIKDYWSRHVPDTQFEFLQVFPINQIKSNITPSTFFILFVGLSCHETIFPQLFQNLHLCNPVSSSSTPYNVKIQPLLDLLCPRFETAFKPGKCIAVDEAMISFKGRASF